MNKELKKVFNKKQLEENDYLDKLSDNEQFNLANLVQEKIDEEGSGLYSTLAMASNFIPNFIKIKIAQDMLGPKASAKMTAYLPTSSATNLAKSMKVEFLAKVALYQKPKSAVAILEAAPEKLLFSISKILLSEGHFDLIAKYADLLVENKLKNLTLQLDDPFMIIEVASRMQNVEKLIDITLQLDNDYLIKLMSAISQLNQYKLAAQVGEKLPIEKQKQLLEKLNPTEAARLASFYSTHVIAKLIESIEVEDAVNIGLLMQPKDLGDLFNTLDIEILNRFIPYLNITKLVECLPYINMKKVENNLKGFTPTMKNVLEKLAQDNETLKTLLQAI